MRRRGRSLTATIVVLLAALAAGGAVPGAAAADAPDVANAPSAVVVDASDGTVMFAKRARERRPIASTTKLMTALLVLERAKPGDVFTAPDYHAGAAESKINLSAGERMRVSDLLEALLLESANDAAETIAENVSGSRAAFVAQMNARARQLGLRDTRYANPIGLDDPDNYSTARDLARLARTLMARPRFARVVDMPEAVLESGSHRRVIDNRNDLVARFPFVDGIKTGHTSTAGYLLVGAAHSGNGAKVITVVMDEPGEAARDADTVALMRWGLAQFRSVPVLAPRKEITRVPVDHRDAPASLVPRRALTVTVRSGERVDKRVRAPDSLDGPLPAGRAVGSVTVLRGGKAVSTVPLVTARAIPATPALTKLWDAVGIPLVVLLALGMLIAAALAARRLRGRVRLVRER